MEKVKKRVIYILFVILLSSFSITSFAHPGRTDSNGGHHDNKNKSGLGSYHYHHGMGPHLHPGGVCPYGAGDSQTSSYTPSPSISIKNYPETLNVGESGRFEYSVSNATNNEKVVVSSDDNVVRVDSNGILIAEGEGVAQITIKASGVTNTFSVRVVAVPMTEIKITNEIDKIQLGESYQLEVNVFPENATNKNIVWSSDNDEIIEISGTGVINTKSAGIATVTATSVNNIEYKTRVEVYEVFPKTIKCDNSVTLIVGENENFQINILPENANNKEYTVTCDNDSVLKYSNGSIQAVFEGETVLHIETWNGIKRDVPVRVEIIPVDGVEIIDSTDYLFSNVIDKSSEISLAVEISPSDATYQNIEWTSSQEDIVEVKDDEFIVQGVGKVTLTCLAQGGITNSIEIIVIDKIVAIIIMLVLVVGVSGMAPSLIKKGSIRKVVMKIRHLK